jgi:hypothetical protein
MRNWCTVLSLLFVLVLIQPVQAQIEKPFVVESVVTGQKAGVCGAPLLWEKEQAALQYLAQHPELRDQQKLQKTAWNFTVGSQKAWYADDLNSSSTSRYLAPSTCRAVGTNCYIFVEDAVWLNRVTQSAVDAVKNAFDSSTPANAAKGIYQTNVETFGNAPNVDNDSKIIIFILDIKDRYSDIGSGPFTVGYFYSYNQQPLSQSNLAEMLYIDANPLDLRTASGLQSGLSTTAHEFQHMQHYNYDTDELTFINEGCSLAAEVICGYPIYDQSYYTNETNIYLLSWRRNDPNVVNDYSRAARFFTYLYNQAGVNVLKSLVQNGLDGVSGIDAALQAIGYPLRFNDIFQNFTIANILDDKNVNPAYGYTYSNLPKVEGRLLANPNVATTNSNVQYVGAEYLSFIYGANLTARFTVADPRVVIKAVEIGPSSKRVLDVTPNVDFVEPNYGTTYTEIHFVATNISSNLAHNYTYQATGIAKAVELKWDQNEPAGFLRLSVSDTQCVTFDAVPTGKLDSIRVALRRRGSITGGVWEYTEVTRPTPLGKPLAYPVTASVTNSPPVPYPVPWPNWGTIDLRSAGITTDKPFAVAFVIRNPDTPAVMITRYPGQSPFHSFTYLNQPGSGSEPDWFYLTADASNIWIYLIRAYVSFTGTTGVRETVELAPRTFALAQNYPNPFNPSTTIEFALPQASQVTLKMFNALGEEVATLVNGKRLAGKHQVVWNAEGLPSGLYFYRLEGEGFVETKRLLLMK